MKVSRKYRPQLHQESDVEGTECQDGCENLPDSGDQVINNISLEEARFIESRMLDIFERIDEKTVSRIISQMDYLVGFDDKSPITIRINCGGGNMLDGFAIYDVIRMFSRRGTPIRTIALGKCCSMAVPIFLAGDFRNCLPNTSFMMHDASAMLQENTDLTSAEMIDMVEEFERLEEMHVNILARRTGLSKSRWTELTKNLRKDWFFGKKRAKELGFLTK